MINALWLMAIAVAAGFGSVSGLLAILCLFVMDGVIELKAVRAQLSALADVFALEAEPLTEERANALTDAVMERVRQEMVATVARRSH